MNSFRLFIAAVLLAASSAAAPANLWDIYQIALDRDAQYAEAKHNYEAAKLAGPLARSALLPALSLQGNAARRDGENDNNGALNVDLRLFDSPTRRAYAQAKLQVLAAETNYADARSQLILRVAENYFEVLAAADNRDVARSQQVAIKRQLDFSTQLLGVGTATQTDVYDAQARFQQASADVIAADTRIDNAVYRLAQITGGDVPALAKLNADAPLVKPNPANSNAWVSAALQNNRALQAEDFLVQVAELETEKQKAARMPSLSLRLRRDWRDSDSALGDDSSATATLNWQLYRGGALHLQGRRAGLQHNAAMQSREALKRRVESDAASAYLAVVSGVSQVQALANAVRAGEAALLAKQEGFQAGLTTNLDVLDAQRDLTRSRTEYFSARYEFILSVLRLQHSAGDLDEADVKEVNGWLQG